jgi:glycosyltransferase involved in cell wall biosynthesis
MMIIMEATRPLSSRDAEGLADGDGATRLVAAQTAYPIAAASPRVRLAAFAPHLSRYGIRLRYQPTLSDAEYRLITSEAAPARKAATLGRAAIRLAARGRDHADEELMLVHRLRFLAPLPGVEPARHVDAYDFDDALYLGSTLFPNRRFGWVKREAQRWRSYVRRARLVIAGNDLLASRAAEFATRVEVVPSCVDPESQSAREHAEREVVTIGWIGSRSTADQLREVLPAVAALNEDGLVARLVLIGAGEIAGSPPWLEQRPWSLDSESENLSSFDLGIMPLPDTEWARGKCGYKILQYFSAGVPAVASPVGVNAAIIGREEERGLLASTFEEWRTALTRLVTDAEARATMGAEARRFVEREYSYQRWAPELATLLKEL